MFPPQEDGYHPIYSIFQTISLYDTLSISTQKNKTCTISSNTPSLPTDSSNILSKTYQILKDKLPYGFKIHIDKHIPIGGGMGGGSTNAAGFLTYLNDNFLKLPLIDLISIAKYLGADIPFFLVGGTALVTGIGEKIQPIPTLNNKTYLLITPPIHSSTADIFKNFDSRPIIHKKVIAPPPALLKNQLGENSLKDTVFNLYPEFKVLEKWIVEQGHTLYMSGSGATTFIAFDNKDECDTFSKKVHYTFPNYSVSIGWPIQ